MACYRDAQKDMHIFWGYTLKVDFLCTSMQQWLTQSVKLNTTHKPQVPLQMWPSTNIEIANGDQEQ